MIRIVDPSYVLLFFKIFLILLMFVVLCQEMHLYWSGGGGVDRVESVKIT